MTKKLPIIKYLIPLTLLLISTNVFASVSFSLNSPQPNGTDILMSGNVSQGSKIYVFDYNTGQQISVNFPSTNNGAYLISQTFSNLAFSKIGLPLNGHYNFYFCSVFAFQCNGDTNGTYHYISETDYINKTGANTLATTTFVFFATPVATALLGYLNVTDIGNTKGAIQTNIVGGVSNLWPIVTLILGILITFYVLEKIIQIFRKNTKETKERKHGITIYGARGGRGLSDKIER
jgi:hypothetical protein